MFDPVLLVLGALLLAFAFTPVALYLLFRGLAANLAATLREVAVATDAMVVDLPVPSLSGQYRSKPLSIHMKQVAADGAWSLVVRLACACPFTMVLVTRRAYMRHALAGSSPWGPSHPLDLGESVLDRTFRVGPEVPGPSARAFLLDPEVGKSLQKLSRYSWIRLDEGLVEAVMHDVSPGSMSLSAEDLLATLESLADCAGRLERQRPVDKL